jgi:serine/threonine-protein kinase
MIGETIGSYKVLSQIGRGGMGIVYLAEHPLIGRKVAIKVILPEHSQQGDTLARFFNEARATARLRHPSLVDTIDFGTHRDGSAYIIMEYLEGENLGSRLKRVGKMPVWEAARLTRQVAEGVGVAHAAMIVHRDLKPDNIFLSPHPATGDDQAKILDFGIAKLTGPDEGGTHTRTGVMVGTPLFMAPEQCRGSGQVDHRADIYSLGCILYRMLCGQPPFNYSGIGELIAAHLTETPPAPRSIDPSIPEDFEAIIVRALSKRVEDRYPNMAAFIADLDAASTALTTAAYSAAGGSTVVLPADAAARRPHPSSPLSPLSPSLRTPLPPAGLSGAAPRPGPAAPVPHAGLEGGTQVLQQGAPLPPTAVLPAVSAEQSQRLRGRTTFSGASGQMDAVQDGGSLKKKKPPFLIVGIAAAGVVGVVSVGLLASGDKPAQVRAVQVASAPPAPAPQPPPPPVAPAPEEKPLPSAAEKAPPSRPEPPPVPAHAETAAPAGHRGEAKQAAAAPRSRTVRVTVANAPEGLAVLVDGRPGRLPLRLPMDGKPHVLRFESARTRPETKSITADSDQTVELANKPKLLLD